MLVRCTACTALLLIAGALTVRGQDPACSLVQTSGVERAVELPPPTVLPPANADEESPLCPCPEATERLDPAFADRFNVFEHRRSWPEVWGFTGIDVFASGKKMGPNGQLYYPLGTLFADLNVGFLPEKRLYIYGQGVFWAQKPTSGVTNGDQSNFDFSKRQMDLTLGGAWRYYGPLEFRAFAFSFNNLNRGFDLNVPEGYNDGVGFENRYYIFKSNAYDLPRLNFLSLGYMPTKEITGQDGYLFKPGFFARAYLTYEFVRRKYYVFADTEMLCQTGFDPRLLFFNDGFAARPFDQLPGLEFRIGAFNTVDVQVDITRTLPYFLVQVIF